MRIASGQPLAFISYARRDDVAYRGKISEFRHYLELLAGAALGRDFQIRQDISAIGWGQHWPSRLNELLDSASLLIPFITPSFFTSDVCPLELEKFLELERRTGRRDLVLPVYFRTAPELETGSHPLARVLLERQIRDWRELRYLPLEQTEVLRALDGLADEIAETIRRLEQASAALPDARARLRLGRLPEAEEPVHAAGLEKASQWPAGRIFGDRDQRWCPEMIVVPTGSFPMGSPPDEEGRLTNEGPLHRVYISRAFALGRFPVTFEEFGHFVSEVGRDVPIAFHFSRRPVVGVSWEDAAAYALWLAGQTDQPYRLPSEAEWEYACRAGTTTRYCTGATIIPEQANYWVGDRAVGTPGLGYGARTTPVGTFAPNDWGLSDMHGNVWEWVQDCWHESYDGAPDDGSAWVERDCERRVLRGGSWANPPSLLRSACRRGEVASDRLANVGFRIARTL